MHSKTKFSAKLNICYRDHDTKQCDTVEYLEFHLYSNESGEWKFANKSFLKNQC